MPVVDYPYTVPADPEQIIWRYLKPGRFEQMLERRELFFAKASSFLKDDPFEGAVLEKEVSFRQQMSVNRFGSPKPLSFDHAKMVDQEEAHQRTHKEYRDMVVVSCWYSGPIESASMWRLFAPGGVTIRSSVKSLHRALSQTPGEIYGSKVRYIDYQKDVWFHRTEFPHIRYNFLTPFVHKRRFFSTEQEYRLYHRHDGWSKEEFWEMQESKNGLFVPIDPEELIHEVVVAPGTSESRRQELESLIRSYGFPRKVSHSEMDRQPSF